MSAMAMSCPGDSILQCSTHLSELGEGDSNVPLKEEHSMILVLSTLISCESLQ